MAFRFTRNAWILTALTAMGLALGFWAAPFRQAGHASRHAAPPMFSMSAAERAQARAYAHFLEGVLREEAGDPARAVEFFRKAALYDKTSIWIRVHLAFAYYQLGQDAQAESMILEADPALSVKDLRTMLAFLF